MWAFGRMAALMGAWMLTSCAPSGPLKYPVAGAVRINGQPAKLVRVQFRHVDEQLPGNLKYPAGMTDADGQFALSTSGLRDGAVTGEYIVTFEWMSENDIRAFDKLGGRFADPASSPFRITVAPRANVLPPFELTLPDDAILTQPRKAR